MKQNFFDKTHRIVLVLPDEEKIKMCYLVLKNPFSFKVVSSYLRFEDALEKTKVDKPTLMIVDIDSFENLPEGLLSLSTLKTKYPALKILILTHKLDLDILTKALQSGASGYVLYEDGIKCLYDAVDDILGGGTPVSKKVLKLWVNSFQISTDWLLSRREIEVLREVATGKTYTYVAHELNISVDTVRSHVQHIFEKLNVKNKSEAVIKAREERLV